MQSSSVCVRVTLLPYTNEFSMPIAFKVCFYVVRTYSTLLYLTMDVYVE